MRHFTAAVLAAARAGCIDHDHELAIENLGSQPILVSIEKEYGPWSVRRDECNTIILAGFTSWVGRYTSQIEKIGVAVWRESDGVLL